MFDIFYKFFSIIAGKDGSWIWMGLLVLLLAACSTAPTGLPDDPEAAEITSVATVAIEPGDTHAELEQRYDGSVVLFKPEAGFAIMGFTADQTRLTTLSTDPNEDTLTLPEATAAGWTAWSGGWTAWSGGWTAWSGGWTAWSGGVAVSSTLAENLETWEQIRLPYAQHIATNLGSGVKIAVIDTGVTLDHPAFDGKLAPSSEWMDYVDGDAYPNDDEFPSGSNHGYGHGTGVAGIILQVSPNATILPIRVLDPEGTGDTDDIALAIDHAVAMGADVINLSLGTTVDIAVLRAMVDYATAQGVFVVCSTGNEGSSDVLYPARYSTEASTSSYAISVGSVDDHDRKSSFSNYGVGTELHAPGEHIYTLLANDEDSYGMGHTTGTSFAAPMVAGAIGLALGENPTAAQTAAIQNALFDSALRLDYLNSNFAGQLGAGRLDIEAFLAHLGFSPPSPDKNALLVARSTWLTDSESYLRDHLELLGFQVTIANDDYVDAGQAYGQDLILISESVSSFKVGSTFRNVAVPVILWEDFLFDDMGMSTSATGETSGHDELSFVGDHPLGLGFTGDVEVFDSGDGLAWGTPSSGAIVVATVPGDPAKAAMFAYESGSRMVGMSAPAKRLALFFPDNVDSFSHLSTALFYAAVFWSVTPGGQ